MAELSLRIDIGFCKLQTHSPNHFTFTLAECHILRYPTLKRLISLAFSEIRLHSPAFLFGYPKSSFHEDTTTLNNILMKKKVITNLVPSRTFCYAIPTKSYSSIQLFGIRHWLSSLGSHIVILNRILYFV